MRRSSWARRLAPADHRDDGEIQQPLGAFEASARRPDAGDKVLQPSLAFFYDAVGQGHGTGESPMNALDAMPSMTDRIRHDLVGLKILIKTALKM